MQCNESQNRLAIHVATGVSELGGMVTSKVWSIKVKHKGPIL